MTHHIVEVEASELASGPQLIVVSGQDRADSDFRLGTREIDVHSHLRGQFFCVDSGLLHVRTEHGSWLLPPQRAGWIPPGLPHRVSVSGAHHGWSVFITPEASQCLPDRPCVIGISELMRALVLRAVTWSVQVQLNDEQARVIAVLLDEMRSAPHQPLHLPLPSDRRLLKVTQAILAKVSDERTLEEWATWAGLSPRTLSRLFRSETACSFSQWRQQARLSHALERLALGESVANVADALGYASPSHFIAMFKRNFGDSPAHYFAQRANVGEENWAGLATCWT
ncbi:helix-turn-helix transcriptional regulator [Iodobacter sp. LRB]|uniref:AraC family transcriptional regulator n=1 Tax=unclassified Iodobacter TaxID=235634 RepID=UPI000C0DB99D|nr:helix-turn-helix transcriptional regulator [Iodobacter sp. BJB302]PHV00412.1 AraC family transcriptional regulator [Iodobacter sp. BJB302]